MTTSLFCPKCKSLLYPTEGNLVCRECGFEKPVTDINIDKIREGAIERETLVLYGDMDTLPRTKVECPKCSHNEAAYVIRQTRAADEPSTRIYRCAKCMYTWREF